MIMNAFKRISLFAFTFSMFFAACKKDVAIQVPVKEKTPDSVVAKLDSQVIANIDTQAVATDVKETEPPVWSSVVHDVNSNVAGFWQGVPAKYSSTSKSYPLIVFIHGIGELGKSLSSINCCGLPKHLKNKSFPANFNVNGVNHSFIVVAPQFKHRPTPKEVQSVIDFAKKRWRIDASRVYVTGMSMGGGSTWDWSAVYGNVAAAIVPVCGGTKPTTSMASSIASKNVPIWALYSNNDGVVPVQWGKDFLSWVDARNSVLAPKTKLTIWYDGLNHNGTWARAFNPLTKVDGYNIYQWMLLHRRTV
jgi:predicted peptidase